MKIWLSASVYANHAHGLSSSLDPCTVCLHSVFLHSVWSVASHIWHLNEFGQRYLFTVPGKVRFRSSALGVLRGAALSCFSLWLWFGFGFYLSLPLFGCSSQSNCASCNKLNIAHCSRRFTTQFLTKVRDKYFPTSIVRFLESLKSVNMPLFGCCPLLLCNLLLFVFYPCCCC